MKAVVLAGGKGIRMRSDIVGPKPLLEIGGRPALDHLFDLYHDAGIDEFVVCGGYGIVQLSEWLGAASVSATALTNGKVFELARGSGRSINVLLFDTGLNTTSGGRLRRVLPHVGKTFSLAYCDGFADIDIGAVVGTHERTGALVTITGLPLRLRYGVASVVSGSDTATNFKEKPTIPNLWVNGGFQVVEASVVEELCHDDDTRWETDVLPLIAEQGRLAVHRHPGFWFSMDYPHEHDFLQRLWRTDGAAWRRTS